jgi:hypothetical protein
MADNEKLTIIDEEAQALFTNLISFNINPEEVCMGLGIRDVKDPNTIKVHSYLHMTIPHFLRYAEAVNKQVELLIEKGVISREPEQ